ncbi:MAG: DEAD/DEAH box helicase [Candidatus Dojkabacteria bacterium]
MIKNISSKNLLELLNRGYTDLEKDILEKKSIAGIDPNYYELALEMLGNLLKSSVWLFQGQEDSLGKNSFSLSSGELFDIKVFLDFGYKKVERVWNEGEISVLGDVVIIWPFSMVNIVRLSLLGDRVELIDIVDSSSRKKIKSIKKKTFLNNSSELLVGNEDAEESINLTLVSNIGFEGNGVDLGIRRIPNIESYVPKRAILEIINNYKSRGYEILYVTSNLERYETDVSKIFEDSIDSIFEKGNGIERYIKRGFVSNISKVLVLTDLEVLGEIDLSLYQEKNISIDPGSIEILKKILPGDYVVHEDHGIGKYIDILKKENGYYIEIAYAGKDKLYVPLSASDKLTKYVGAGKVKPKLTGLNSGIWSRISKKAKEKAENIAKELLQLYALRKIAKTEPVISTQSSLEELELFLKKFEFEDTDDQLLATKQLIDDFQKGKPMDRLLVGDVGYGKTEIAMRAIFATANEGFQVAVLAPTTVLVQQHLATFRKRFKDYAFNILSLSRFSSQSQKQEVLDGLSKGTVDIVIGTHSLLSDDISFKNLGLLVIDEEQKFGVKQKEKIKENRVTSNVLSMTATPIPRTLSMALSGIRDISVLATPPLGRREIINHFDKLDWNTIEIAIKKELERKGQVYFLHNRVSTIQQVYDKLIKLFPHSSIAIAHGQMHVQDLYKAMTDFINGDVDILVCTTIIENGLDIPNVNTLIVEDASMLGLSQMYQIRGRIGRSEKQAYAYFFYNNLNGDVALRLEAMKESQELGSGFLLSNKDLEIRGAGDILGSNQSGTINSVGYGLYTQMLNEAVERLRGVGK